MSQKTPFVIWAPTADDIDLFRQLPGVDGTGVPPSCSGPAACPSPPMNDIAKHLVYGENGSSLELAMVNGEIVLRDGRLTRIDEDAILREVRELVRADLAEHAFIEERNRVLEPCFAEAHRRATLQDIGLNRYAGDMPPWPGTNVG